VFLHPEEAGERLAFGDVDFSAEASVATQLHPDGLPLEMQMVVARRSEWRHGG
jgi:hypothetical protein